MAYPNIVKASIEIPNKEIKRVFGRKITSEEFAKFVHNAVTSKLFESQFLKGRNHVKTKKK